MNNEGFLSRWSRRKVETKEEVIVEPQIEPISEVNEEAVLPVILEGEKAVITKDQEALIAELPDIETLTEASDFSGFMQTGVPEELKKLALRKLWRSNPVFANLDGLNDYDEDFNIITPLAAGVAEELLKMMKENSRPTPEPEEEVVEEGEDEETETEGEVDNDVHDVGEGEDE